MQEETSVKAQRTLGVARLGTRQPAATQPNSTRRGVIRSGPRQAAAQKRPPAAPQQASAPGSPFKAFKVNEVVFLAVLSVVLTLAGMLTMPIVMAVPVFGLRNAAAAILYGLFLSIGLLKVRKPGALVLLALFNGAVLLFMTPIMFFNNLFASLLSEVAVLAVFRSYTGDRSVVAAAALFAPLTLPLSLVFTMLFNGLSFEQVIENPLLTVGLCALTMVLSLLGALLGHKIGSELKKAGVLK
ncbi:MAG: MptD family putative ECF transporter S component [Coriobacteriales bacterium]|jgi:energy-coupling factor transport system substrate-specific component|nr:MptD family putative ECF transporter S component [Coriobacteriales bacterium]